MKGITAAALLLLVLALAVSGAAQDDARAPVAEIGETNFDFGEVFEKDEYRHVFTVRNRGKADLLIEDVKPG